MIKRHSLAKSFYYAFNGLKTAFLQEPNLRIHLGFAVFAVILAIILGVNLTECVILTFTIFIVIVLELLNTAIESIVNIASPELNQFAKVAKDVSAGMVLVAAMTSIIIGLLVFLPKILIFI